jgi:hypothetical protein
MLSRIPTRLAGVNVTPDFTSVRTGRRLFCLRHDLARDAPAILAQIDRLGRTSREGAGNRGGGFQVTIDNRLRLFCRRARRGGLLSMINPDVYFGRVPRPLRELAVAAQAYQAGLPVAEPLGAMIELICPGLYRGAFFTRALQGMTLWEFLRVDDDRTVRCHVVEQARHAIERIHQGGLVHADLNLHNLFVTRAGDSFAVIILDLDKARLLSYSLSTRMRQRSLNRLARSVRRLEQDGCHLEAGARGILLGESG